MIVRVQSGNRGVGIVASRGPALGRLLGAGALACLLGLVACSGGDARSAAGQGPAAAPVPASSAGGASSVDGSVDAHGGTHGQNAGAAAGRAGRSSYRPASSASAARVAAPSELAEVGVRLQALIGQHSVLAADMMRARLRGDADFAQAADAALGKNTRAMGSLVDSLFGAEAGKQFSTMWADHVRALFAYAQALGGRDTSGQQDARTALLQLERRLAEFFAGASKGRLDPATAEAAVRTHIDHLLGQADAFAAEDYPLAARRYREAYRHGFDMGGALAGALMPPDTVRTLKTPSWQLRAAFTRLLGEHVALVTAAMRASSGNAADVSSIAAGLNANTVELASSVDSLFGPEAARGFQSLWADHVDNLMAYTTALARQDASGRDRALTGLRSFERSLAAFLSGATKSRISADALTQAFLMHDRMLLQGLDAFAARDYGRAHTVGYQAYEEMFALSGQLSNAIGSTLAARRPAGGSQTGGGGMAAVAGRR